jgi:hypothetical protein
VNFPSTRCLTRILANIWHDMRPPSASLLVILLILTISPTRHPVCVQAHKRTNWAASLCRRHRACDAVRWSTDRSRGCRLQFRYANSPLLNPSLSHRLQQPRSLRLRLQVPWCRTFSSRWLTICMCVFRWYRGYILSCRRCHVSVADRCASDAVAAESSHCTGNAWRVLS